ncbi:glycosyltransferase domain protein, partial [Vibrio parahaemolyticus V-223/04]
IW